MPAAAAAVSWGRRGEGRHCRGGRHSLRGASPGEHRPPLPQVLTCMSAVRTCRSSYYVGLRISSILESPVRCEQQYARSSRTLEGR